MNTAKGILNIVSAVFALAAAILWFQSTVVKVQPNEMPDGKEIIEGSIDANGADVVATARRQNYWNRWGALAAAIAALAQGISLLIPST